MSRKASRKLRRQIKNELNSFINTKSALSGTYSYIGLVSSNGGKIKVRIPDLDIFEMFDSIGEAVQKMQNKIEEELYNNYYKVGKPIPTGRSANNIIKNKHEFVKLFIARDPQFLDISTDSNTDIKIMDIIDKETSNNIKSNCEYLYANSSNRKEDDNIIEVKDEEIIRDSSTNNDNTIIEDVNSNRVTIGKASTNIMYKHVCPNPRCNKVFYLTPKQEYHQRRYREDNPDAHNVCCSKSCTAEYREIINRANNITPRKRSDACEEIKELMSLELICKNCKKPFHLTKERSYTILSRIRKDPSKRDYVLSHVYCNRTCSNARFRINKEEKIKALEVVNDDNPITTINDNPTTINETINETINNENIDTTNTIQIDKNSNSIDFDEIVSYLKSKGLVVDSINLSLKLDK